VQAPFPPPSPWGSLRTSAQLQKPIVVVVLLLFAGLVTLVVLASAFGGFGGTSLLGVLLPFCGVFVVFIVLAIAAAAGVFRRAPLPPPPPIQQPMVPAGRLPPIAINCPNCGAPPGNVDRFGVATCTHCGNRFIVQ